MTKRKSKRERNNTKQHKHVLPQQNQEKAICFYANNVAFPGIPRVLGTAESSQRTRRFEVNSKQSLRSEKIQPSQKDNSKQSLPSEQIQPIIGGSVEDLLDHLVQEEEQAQSSAEDIAQTSTRSVSTSTYSHMRSEISLDSNFKLVKPGEQNIFYPVIFNNQHVERKIWRNTALPAQPLVKSNIAKSSTINLKEASKLTLQSRQEAAQQQTCPISRIILSDFYGSDGRSDSVCEREENGQQVVEPEFFFNFSRHLKHDWLQQFRLKWEEKKSLRKVDSENKALVPNNEMQEITDRLSKINIPDVEIVVIDDDESDDHSKESYERAEPFLPDFSPEQNAAIRAAMRGPPDEVLVSKFKMSITRRCMQTLDGLNWLNDEVINFYMNLLIERNAASVYAMNTFFIPRLLQSGYVGVKRWTRKIDLFSKEIIPVPVHVAGIHWAMAIINLKYKTIKYYDSMCKPNPKVLIALAQYLVDEYQDKKKQSLDIRQFVLESVDKLPRQSNCSDCGVFSCMFAEYITRDAKLTFSQEDMGYFRHKMILEILRSKLLT